MVAIAEEAFADVASLKYGELKQAIMKIRGVREGAAENWLKKMAAAKVISKTDLGHYIKTT